ncbi:unnamed protein product [Caenorhabditis bovis]|uniref:Uncharacterized protein n=1 Tax=Caenorhabditis bovis TaxID=2654633 RepID=A0A8S1EV99_9PELO|nr:unnamed protein product [Caenorhabditis bovis]
MAQQNFPAQGRVLQQLTLGQVLERWNPLQFVARLPLDHIDEPDREISFYVPPDPVANAAEEEPTVDEPGMQPVQNPIQPVEEVAQAVPEMIQLVQHEYRMLQSQLAQQAHFINQIQAFQQAQLAQQAQSIQLAHQIQRDLLTQQASLIQQAFIAENALLEMQQLQVQQEAQPIPVDPIVPIDH